MPEATLEAAPAAQSPSPSPAQSTGEASNFLSDLDMGGAVEDGPSKHPEVPKIDPEPESKRPELKTPEVKKPEVKPAPDAKAKPPEAAPSKAVSPMAMLRDALENEKRQRIALETEVQSLRNGKPTDHPEFKTVQQRLEAVEKRREELENEIRLSNYEKSEEYRDRHEKPFLSAYGLGRQKVSGLEIQEITDEATGQVTQKGRPATPEDFDRIMSITNDREASKLARQLFGDDSPIVIHHRERVMDLNHARHQAIDEARKTSAEKMQRETETQAKQRESRSGLWKQTNSEIESKFPDWLKSREGDDEGNKLLDLATRQADMAFSENNGLTPDDNVKLHALIRSRAAAFPRTVHENGKLKSRVAELEAELKAFQQSEPKPGDGRASNAPVNEFEELLPDA